MPPCRRRRGLAAPASGGSLSQGGNGLSGQEVLVGAELTDGLDAKGLLDQVGGTRRDASERVDRGVGEFLRALALVGLVELLLGSLHGASSRSKTRGGRAAGKGTPRS